MKLKELLINLNYELIQGSDNIEIKNIGWDSRRVKPNSLFICVKNKNIDRHDYAASAVLNGATALVIEHDIEKISENITIIKVPDSKKAMAKIASLYYGEPSKKFNLIGITGTNGKTSVTYFVSKILENAGRLTGIIGTIQNTVGGKELKAAKLNPTTPDSIELQESFNEIFSGGASDVVMEVTSSALDKGRVYECHFNIGVFTNLTQDHLEEHGTMENYKNAKLKLFKMCKKALINADDIVSKEIREIASGKVYTYGIEEPSDFKAFDIIYGLDSVEFSLKFMNEVKRVKFNIPGKFSVYNALSAIGICYLSGLNLDTIIDGLKDIKGVPGRVEKIPNDKGILAVVDYAHSPDSLENIINSMREIAKGKVITVFGCGGNRDKTKRPIMGEIAGRLSDYVVITSDNPRKEDPITIINEIEQGILKTNCHYEKCENRKEAIFKALEKADIGDVVIIAGKGHETYQIIGDTTIHFDDREVVREYFDKI
ncbi:UDP-N-acetylmuramoyl-L-alanyl-D-glutamate--2,6-diaminopimelate ligase [Clostridium sp. YIM B02515]|uniref:UDP-N-acetylmuramoyl-L-alanyl-D-glutamate--2,6-diaminopimelate ligase n=1 Tax=Clostridium rhizosphaerae TaxID=2803861 RepID=A0ABS1TF57_9CLOT|nr:UDP-N-acetylmuramoyl-L-alanyl-D-glutamate--2,6-diaminopimelate ligase [Clostridium rhizosphaerae]MBL4937387.1 UDP-N-acetylmuramoyl-L-alanyl-D-glutamate--2,6-diaminopimelate ligase [Clostridium rhizosphaerae]